MQEFTKKLASYVFDMPVILDKYFQLQKLGLLGKPSFCSFSQCYQTLLDLFFFRSKIVKAFQDSRIIYQNIATAYDEIEKIIEEI